MNILFQYYTCGGGGLANIVLLLESIAQIFPDDRLDIVCKESSGFSTLGYLDNVFIHTVGGFPQTEVRRAYLAIWELPKIARKCDSDVIWSMNIGLYRRIGIPHVLSVHNAHQVYPWSVVRYHPDHSIHVASLRWFFRRSLLVSDGAITQTDLVADYIRNIRHRPTNIAVVPKSVESKNESAFVPLPGNIRQLMKQPASDPFFTYIYVATATPHKNHRTLISALELLRMMGLKIRIVLTLSRAEVCDIGGDLADRLIMSGHILPVGWADKRYLRELYEACDACVMPSVLECLSSAHLEAMQWNKPQISSDLPFARDICGDAALYASAEDPKDWARKMHTLMTNPSLRASLVDAGHDRMDLMPASWAVAATRVRGFLAQVVENSSTGIVTAST